MSTDKQELERQLATFVGLHAGPVHSLQANGHPIMVPFHLARSEAAIEKFFHFDKRRGLVVQLSFQLADIRFH